MQTKLIIIGGGPSGLTAGIYAARAGLEPVIVTGGFANNNIPGGQLMITTEVENYPGFPEDITGPEIVDKMLKQAIKFGARIVEEFATDFVFGDGGHKVRVGDMEYTARAVIIATGASARWLGLPGEEKYINNGISACATCDGPLPCFRNKDIYVIGGGDSACEEALFLTRFAKRVFMVHRRDKLRASKIMADRVSDHPDIDILWNTEVDGYIGGDDGMIKQIMLRNDDVQYTVECGGIFIAIGHDPNTKELANSGLELDAAGYVKVTGNVYTNVDGVFAAGDCQDTLFKQAITAAGFGCMAAIAAERWIDTM